MYFAELAKGLRMSEKVKHGRGPAGTGKGAAPSIKRRAADPAREFVMSYIPCLVREGLAEWSVLEDGDTELRLKSGEIFHLGKKMVMRIC